MGALTKEMRLPFGDTFTATISAEYIYDNEIKKVVVINVDCIALRIGDPYIHQSGAFVHAGNEAELAHAIADLALSLYSGRIQDACQNDWEERVAITKPQTTETKGKPC
jgi:hypothetical protein